LKDLTSLKAVIEKAMAIKVMQNNNFTQKQDDVWRNSNSNKGKKCTKSNSKGKDKELKKSDRKFR